MKAEESDELAAYRSDVCARIERLRPHTPGRDETGGFDRSAHREWQRELAEAGLIGVTWPLSYGGCGLGTPHRLVVEVELAAAGLPGAFDLIGVDIIGPTIIDRGSDQQRSRYLEPLLRGDEVWCQLFSEPAAGSDLAGIRTRGQLDSSGRWHVSGQKVWTSNAELASFGLCLARTDDQVPKHAGLTMLIIPMDASGVTVRPLRQISGGAHFTEVFLDDVLLSPEMVCGGVGNGWRTAMIALMHERLAVATSEHFLGLGPERFARVVADNPDAARDPVIRRRLGGIGSELLALRLGGRRQLSNLAAGETPGPEGSLGKLTAVHAAAEGCELMTDVLGLDALEPGSEWHEQVCHVPAARSAGGTEEVLRTMVGDRVLGLPAEPRIDKSVPFSSLSAVGKAHTK